MQISIKTLGCKLNQYESELIQSEFERNGWEIVPFGNEADVVIINTCTVTDRSDKKCRSYIRQGAKFSKSGKSIVMGCMAESSEDSLYEMDEVFKVYNNKVKDDIAHSIISLYGDEADFIPSNDNTDIPLKVIKKNRERAFLKIQDGCDGECTYCIVPSVRGIPKSRSRIDILQHAKNLIKAGYAELVLTGITIGKYDDKGFNLANLVEDLVELDGEFRVRITSIEPNHVSEDLMKIIQHEKVCNYIHLPLQSGSSKILKLMKRPYDVDEYKNIVDRLRFYNPQIAIGSDVIVGFPGETEKEFNETIETVKYSKTSAVHQFTFSVRTGTEAANMKQLASSQEIGNRGVILRKIAEELAYEYRKSFLGKTVQTVVEKRKDGTYHAISDNYLRIKLEAGFKKPVDGFNNVKITNVDSPILLGELI